MDENQLIQFLEGMTSIDLSRILLRLPETTNHVPDNVTHQEKVTALVRYMRSSAGPGISRLVEVTELLFPSHVGSSSLAATGRESMTIDQYKDFTPNHNHINTNEKRKFKNYIPKVYLNNLPILLYKAYAEAHKYWDTGITSKMLRGNDILNQALFKFLFGLAETVYEKEFFDGKTVKQYYEDMFGKLIEASWAVQATEGSMGRVIAGGEYSSMIEETITRIVEDVDDPAHYAKWKLKWEEAMTLANEGQSIDIYDLEV